MKIVNLTPHDCVVNNVRYVSQGEARASSYYEKIAELDGTPIVKCCFGEVIGLPEPSSDTFYIVSRICYDAAAANGRSTKDLLMTAKPIRDKSGTIIACECFSQ